MGFKPRRKRAPDPVREPEPKPPHFMHGCSFCYAATQELIIGPQVSICFSCVESARDHVGQVRVTRNSISQFLDRFETAGD